MSESLASEHRRLLRQMEELGREHKSLEGNPGDLEGHREHRARLQKQIAELHAHLERLHREAAPE